jgi:transmembrane sensor
MAAMPLTPDDSLAETLAKAGPALRHHYAAEIDGIRSRARRQRGQRRLFTALVAVIACGTAAWLPFARYQMAAPQHRPLSVPLNGGGSLALDAGAVASLPLLPWVRSVRLDRGEAVFDIVHDESRAFVVSVGPLTLTDRGTRFSVNADVLSVAVFEGVVDMEAPDGTLRRLPAGQAAAFHDGRVATLALPDEAEATAWRQGRIVLRDMPLAEAVVHLSRYRAVPVELGSPAMSGWKVSGSFRIDDADGALAIIEAALPLRVRHEAGRDVLLPLSASSSPPSRKK